MAFSISAKVLASSIGMSGSTNDSFIIFPDGRLLVNVTDIINHEQPLPRPVYPHEGLAITGLEVNMLIVCERLPLMSSSRSYFKYNSVTEKYYYLHKGMEGVEIIELGEYKYWYYNEMMYG